MYKIASITCLLTLLLYFIQIKFAVVPPSLFSSNQDVNDLDSLEFAPNHPHVNISALEQLKDYPSPQFKAGHHLLPNFLWMDPSYLGGLLQPNYNIKKCVQLSTQIQAELATNWHYYFTVNTNLKTFKSYSDTNTFSGAWVKYANEHKNIPAAAISFWAQLQPNKAISDCSAKTAYVYNNQLPDCCYVHNKKGALISRKFASPITPTEALSCDFKTQSVYVDSLLKALKRPLQMINENGEVFRLYEDEFLEQDERIVVVKNKFKDLNWNEFQAMKRFEKEIAYRNSFMQKEALANCLYTEYAIDGQNKYRHDYKIMRKVNSMINHQYYATPDFYPRYPDNWKKWQGPWHGLKWLEITRKTEIELGDYLFSPFVAAGWDSIETNNIRPAQWLGLLKILNVMGAEYYYSGFFNTGKAVAKPENYIWQAAMPVYAQALSSYYEDILRNGSLVKFDKYIQYPKDDVPVVIRKSNTKKIWIIACTWQTGSNYNKNIGIDKVVKINLGHLSLKLKARRQGSIYVYSEEGAQPICYQIDAWHEYKHPSFWSKNIVLEAELFTNKISTNTLKKNDYTSFTTFAQVQDSIAIPFNFHGKTKNISSITFWVNQKIDLTLLSIVLDKQKIPLHEVAEEKQAALFKYVIPLNGQNIVFKNDIHLIRLFTKNQSIMLDRILIE